MEILPGADHLEGDFLAVLIVIAEGAINLTHSPCADLFYGFVNAEPATYPGIIRRRQQARGDFGKGRRVEKLSADVLLALKQKFNFAAHGLIVPAALLQIGVALGGRNLQRLGQNILNFLPMLRGHREAELFMVRCSQSRAVVHSRLAVDAETSTTSAV